MNGFKRVFLIGIVVFFSSFPSFSEEVALGPDAVPAAPLGIPGFGFGLNLGTDVLPVPGDLTGATDSYTRLGFKPDLKLGKFGIGLDLTIRMQLKFGENFTPSLYLPDWIPDYLGNGKSILDVYLPKFLYIRYGERGIDPAHIKLGSIEDLTLGNGFIVGNYSNTLFLPAQRVFGLQTGLDGSLFKFPFVGIEAITGNLAKLDVSGGRLYVRPLAWMETPILNALQIGGTIAIDRDVNAWVLDPLNKVLSPEMIVLYGVDFVEPLFPDPFSLAVYGDLAFQPKERLGAMLGFGGKLFSLLNYGAQLRFMSPGFIPAYFDSNYDRFRTDKYYAVQSAPSGESIIGWYANTGFTMLEGKLKLLMAADGPFKDIPVLRTTNITDYPHLRGTFKVEDGMVAGFGLEAKYEKYFLGSGGDFWGDLISPKDAVIGARISYTMGTAVLFLVYDVKYNPELPGGYEITSSLQADLKF